MNKSQLKAGAGRLSAEPPVVVKKSTKKQGDEADATPHHNRRLPILSESPDLVPAGNLEERETERFGRVTEVAAAAAALEAQFSPFFSSLCNRAQISDLTLINSYRQAAHSLFSTPHSLSPSLYAPSSQSLPAPRS